MARFLSRFSSSRTLGVEGSGHGCPQCPHTADPPPDDEPRDPSPPTGGGGGGESPHGCPACPHTGALGFDGPGSTLLPAHGLALDGRELRFEPAHGFAVFESDDTDVDGDDSLEFDLD